MAFNCDGDQAGRYGTTWNFQDLTPPQLTIGNLPWPCSDQHFNLTTTGHATTEFCSPNQIGLLVSVDSGLHESFFCYGTQKIDVPIAYDNMNCVLFWDNGETKIRCDDGPDNTLRDNTGKNITIDHVYWNPTTQCVKLTGVDILDVAKASARGQAQYVKGATQGELQFCVNR